MAGGSPSGSFSPNPVEEITCYRAKTLAGDNGREQSDSRIAKHAGKVPQLRGKVRYRYVSKSRQPYHNSSSIPKQDGKPTKNRFAAFQERDRVNGITCRVPGQATTVPVPDQAQRPGQSLKVEGRSDYCTVPKRMEPQLLCPSRCQCTVSDTFALLLLQRPARERRSRGQERLSSYSGRM